MEASTGFDTRTQRVQHFAISPRRVADVASGPSDISVHHVYQAESGLWLATDGLGLVRLDPITGKTEVFSKRAGLPSAVVYAVFEDRKGRFWLPTDGAGIAVLDRRKRNHPSGGQDDDGRAEEPGRDGIGRAKLSPHLAEEHAVAVEGSKQDGEEAEDGSEREPGPHRGTARRSSTRRSRSSFRGAALIRTRTVIGQTGAPAEARRPIFAR